MAYLRALGRKPALLPCVFVVVLSAALLLPVAAGASTGSHASALAKAVVDARIGPAHPQAVSKGAAARPAGVDVPRRAKPSQPAHAQAALPSGLDLLLGRRAVSGSAVPQTSITCAASGG